ncbi:alpha/beta hydrolase family esterase [Flavonifractor sp. HCP28S3_F3]|uniref:alpha/beta hydrolase family esterase n=1 Tax=Flavonifractor sp. HCP28S3_F3 TaxID=3438939 RepID=UPI003F89B8B1
MPSKLQITSLVLAAALTVGVTGCTQQPPANESPAASQPAVAEKVSATLLADVVTETVDVDPADPLGTELSGLYSVELELEDGGSRMLYHYIPDTVGYRQPAVAIGVPAAQAADQFIEDSGWKTVAEENGMHLILMVCGEDGWTEDESDYTTAAFGYMDDREYIQMQDSAFYMVGYEDAADAVMAFAVENSEKFAGFAAFGVDNFDTALLDAAKNEPSNADGVMKSEVAVPMWIGASEETESVSALIDYWKSANNCGDEVFSNQYAEQVYQFPEYMANTNEITYDNCSKVLVSIGRDDTQSPEFTSYLYNDFLKRTRRQDSGDINALRPFATNEEKGMDYHTLEVEGVTREFYVYVPTDVANGRYDSVPVVFAFHGGGGSGEEFAARSGWDKLAEERNFIAVFPTGSRGNDAFSARTTWSTDDLPFFEAMRTFLLENYPTDESRIYVSGQSMGSIMSFTIALIHPEWIAACAAASAPLLPSETENVNASLIMPMMWSVGMKDQYFVDENGELDMNNVTPLITEWRDRYGITADESTTYTYQNGNFTGYDYKNIQGITLIREQLVIDKIHAMLPDEVYTLYDFLSCYSRGEDGTSYYMGIEISPEVN